MNRISKIEVVSGSGSGSTVIERQREFILQTFVTVLVAGVLVTLFMTPTYRASAVVTMPSGADVGTARARVLELADAGRASLPATSSSRASRLVPSVAPVSSDQGHGLALTVEGEDPRDVADFANGWAKAYAGDVARAGHEPIAVHRADTPQRPIRPNKTQNFVLSGLLGLFLGLVLAFVRDRLPVRKP